ncbi:unnamed protein product [Caenorhabditis brenneri]
MSTSSRMNRQRNKTSTSNQQQVTPFMVPNASAAMVTRSMHNHVQFGTIAGQQVPTMAMAGYVQPQASHTLEHALIKSIDLINTQAALLTPMTQQAMQINQSIMKMHEDFQQERRRVEEEHRAERRKSDEEHTQRMLKIMDQFKDVVDAIQTIPKMSSSGDAKEATASKSKSSKSDASVPEIEQASSVKKVSISKVAKRTGSPVSPKLRKEDTNPSSSTSRMKRRRNIFVEDKMVGKGEVYDEVNKKFISFKCTFCTQIFYSERRLVVHFHDHHDEEEEEEPKPKKTKK